jgi:CRISPR-associated protein Csm5
MRIKAIILSPIHISSGEEYEKDFNFFVEGDFIYLIDEFLILEKIPNAYKKDKYKMKLTDEVKKYIIEKKLFKRKIRSNFKKFEKPLIETISSNSKPYIPASSIKGAIRSAILNCLINYNKDDNSTRCQEIYNRCRRKRFDEKRVNDTLDKDLVEIFKNILIKEVYPGFNTQIYKTINIKICKNSQKSRNEKVEKIANFVEAIVPNQEFEFEIVDKEGVLSKLGMIANKFYIPKINEDIFKSVGCIEENENCENLVDGRKFENYFYKKGSIDTSKLQGLSNKKFLLNISRFAGAYKKSLDEVRFIKNSHCENKKYTTTKTYALEGDCESKFFENCLVPFGWVLCEIL